MSKVLKALTCKAAVCWASGEPLGVEEIQVDPPGPSEVRVKILCASLCHSDILCWKGFPPPLFPKVFGHEGAGVVESVGEGVTELRERDMVIPTFIGECKECENCKSGMTNMCPKLPISINGVMLDGTSRMSVRGQKLYHFFACSTWTEYTVVNTNYVVKIDPPLPPPHASILSCGFTTGFGSAWKEARLQKGSTVAVFGLGGVGLGAVEGARVCGAARIIGVDVNERKRGKGKVFGMTDFICPRETDKPVVEAIMEMTGGVGVDCSIECTGVPEVLNQAIDCTRQGIGRVILVGASTEPTISINLFSFISGKTLKGTIFGGIKPRSDLPVLISKCQDKELHLEEMLTHEIRLDDINRAFELVKQPDCVKVIIKVSD